MSKRVRTVISGGDAHRVMYHHRKYFDKNPVISFDIETSCKGEFLAMGENRVIGLGISSLSHSMYVDFKRWNPTEILNDLFSSRGLAIAHNAMYDYTHINRCMTEVFNRTLRCTLMMEKILSPHKFKGLDLNSLGLMYGVGKKEDGVDRYLREHKLHSGVKNGKLVNPKYGEVPTDILSMYCMQDTEMTFDIYIKQCELLKTLRY